MGVAGSGKTTVGAALAQKLCLDYADADAFHNKASVAKMAAGHPLDDDDRSPGFKPSGSGCPRTTRPVALPAARPCAAATATPCARPRLA
jgi:carbohydrate kinase (thermoresistant glucokinase family)